MSGEYFNSGLGAEFDDKPREECGVFGIYAPGEDVAALTYDALFALQHRGQDSAGVAVTTPEGAIRGYADLGKIQQALRFGDAIKGLPLGNIASGHVRYGTNQTPTQRAQRAAIQPLLSGNGSSKFSLSHNGHLANFEDLRQAHPTPEECYTDSQLMTYLINQEIAAGAGLRDSIVSVAKTLNGAYSLVIMGENKLYGIRDPKGFRPLMIGELPNGGRALASETGALKIIGATFEREVEPGELVTIDSSGLSSETIFDASEIDNKLCAFEFVYFSRPDNVMHGELVASARRRAGMELANRFPVKADLITDAPDSGTPAAKGYAYKSGLPMMEGLVKNRYVDRSFITAGQAKRRGMVNAKFSAVPEVVRGKSVVLVDDSIIRGTTTKELVEMLRSAGAAQVHVRIASAPYQWPCFMGMDTGDRNQLIAANLSEDEVREAIGADSLAYLPLRDLNLSLGKAAGKVCMACMSGEYPIDLPQHLDPRSTESESPALSSAAFK